MIGRRTLLGLFGGAIGTAASGVSVKDAMALSSDMSPTPDGESFTPANVVGLPDAPEKPRHWRMIGEMRESIYANERARQMAMPAHIRTKKSWSLAFKEHVFLQEEREIRELLERLERDQKFADRVASLLGWSQ